LPEKHARSPYQYYFHPRYETIFARTRSDGIKMKKFFVITLILIQGVFLFVHLTKATVIDDFNGYQDGSLNGQGGWVGGDDFLVQGGVTYSPGGKAIKYQAPSTGEITLGGQNVTQSLSINLRRDDEPEVNASGAVFVRLYDIDGNQVFVFDLESNGTIYRNDDFIGTWTPGTWQTVSVDVSPAVVTTILLRSATSEAPSYFDFIQTQAAGTAPQTVEPQGGGSAPTPTFSGGGPTQFRPSIKVQSPSGGVFGGILLVEYRGNDDNDLGGGDTRGRFGLGTAPVSLHYSDLIDVWDYRIIPPEDKTLIVKDLPAIGTYQWRTDSMPEGDRYRIIAEVTDNFGDTSQDVSGFFSIDHAAPVFTVKTDPAVTKGEDIKIILEASEDLLEPPAVTVKQRGYRPVGVVMTGEKRHFEAVYHTIFGYDGPAIITAQGKDVAGNESNRIVSGGRFSVTVQPPEAPVIISPLDKDLVDADTIVVNGTARADTEIVLTVNGLDTYKVKPDADGNFSIANVAISKTFNRGVNFLSVTAEDLGGNVGEAVSISVKFDSKPELSILSPKSSDILVATSTIRVEGQDQNNDKLVFRYEISRDNGANWLVLGDAKPERRLTWDTRDYPDGKYSVRVTASDGISNIEKQIDAVAVRNYLPLISFTDGERSGSKTGAFVVAGVVSVSPDLADPMAIASLEYSLDGGKEWKSVVATDGAFNSSAEQFSIAFKDFKEGIYSTLWRARDARGLYGKAVKIVIVDFGPPVIPVVTSPKLNQYISDADDKNKDIAGVQITVTGTAEPQSMVTVTVGDKKFTGVTGGDGQFAVPGVTIRTHGGNSLSIFAVDIAENRSEATTFSVLYNNPPTIKFLHPRAERGLNHEALVRWEIKDVDGDRARDITLSYRKGAEATFTTLVKNTSNSSYAFDVSNLPDAGDYQLKLEATDGITPVSATVPFFVDNEAPAISLTPFPETVFRKGFVLEASGRAYDNFSGVEFVEYSIDKIHWFKAVITDGFLSQAASFKVRHPFALEDGSYTVQFRSVDRAGNISTAQSQEIIVDTTPPRVGSFTISQGGIVLFPVNGYFQTLFQSPMRLVISMEEDTRSAELFINKEKVLLRPSGGLWEADLPFATLGTSTLAVAAVDAVGNVLLPVTIGSVLVWPQGVVRAVGGEPLAGAKITVSVFNPDSDSFVRWDGESYDVSNPLTTDAVGEYALLLPEGRYRLTVQRVGFVRVRSSDIILSEPRFVSIDFTLLPRAGIQGVIENILEKLSF